MNRDLSIFQEEKRCENCLFAHTQEDSPLLLCEKKGEVAADFLCRKYSLHINSKAMKRRHLHNIKPLEPFSLD